MQISNWTKLNYGFAFGFLEVLYRKYINFFCLIFLKIFRTYLKNFFFKCCIPKFTFFAKVVQCVEYKKESTAPKKLQSISAYLTLESDVLSCLLRRNLKITKNQHVCCKYLQYSKESPPKFFNHIVLQLV